jgi:hypothetical protein
MDELEKLSYIQRAIEIKNDLHKLIPVGTVSFANVPVDQVLPQSIPCHKGSQWNWLDLKFLNNLQSCHLIVRDIHFLIHYGHCMATFKVFHANALSVNIVKLRLYIIPQDIQDSKYIKKWRETISSRGNIVSQIKLRWSNILSVLSFDDTNWTTIGTPLLLFDFTCTTFKYPGLLSVVMFRWMNNQNYEPQKSQTKPGYNLHAAVEKIYSSIDSPNLSKYSAEPFSLKYHLNPDETISNILYTRCIAGVNSDLYPFQIESICKMLEQETCVRTTVDPNYIKVRSPGSSTFYYYNLTKHEFRLEPDMQVLPKGGILAENMGFGKTLICLSLICLTKFDISKIPDNLLLHCNQDEHSNSLKSLSELCTNAIISKSIPWKIYKDILPESVFTSLNESPGTFKITLRNGLYDPLHSLRTRPLSKRYSQIQYYSEGVTHRTLYLCSTTIIVVPDNLLHQWANELKKHITSSFLNKLFISSQVNKKVKTKNSTYINKIPEDPKYLIDFDLVFITTSFLSRKVEENDCALNMVYWKRLIIDEGHSMNSRNTKTSKLCSGLMAERKWAVTGTPTSGLTQLYMDEQSEEKESNAFHKNKYIVKNQFDEKKDLMKLGSILGQFLGLEPYNLQPKLWKVLIDRIEKGNGDSDIHLINLLNHIMVRHREVDKDLKLPQLHHDAVFIEPSFHNKLSVDLFTAVLAVNAVSSERTDIDYMFHPANKQQLRKLITNLQRATFHWTGFKQDDIKTLIGICEICLKEKSSKYTTYDVSLLQKAIEISKRALDNPRWRTSSTLHEMDYFITGLPNIFCKYFGIGIVNSEDVTVFGAPQINAIQEFVYKNRFMDMNDDVNVNLKLDEASKKFWTTYWKENTKRNEEIFHRQDSNQDFSTNLDIGEVKDVNESPHPSTDVKLTISPTKQNKPKMKEEDLKNEREEIEANLSFGESHMSFQSLKNAKILGTASSKLSYLGCKLLEHQRNKIKSLVFFEFEDSAYYLAELLDILGVKYILYATFIRPTERAMNLIEFTSYNSELHGGITMIMDLRLAAHGLTVIAATYVYFISPVWQKSVEAQAIKRAHRIGQTKEVYVQTLILKGTLEEEIYKQRSDSSGKYLMDNKVMQDFVLRHNFLDFLPNELEYAKFTTLMNISNDSKISQQDSDQEYSLASHILNNDSTKLVHEWTMKLFTADNLEKLNIQNAKKFSSTSRKLALTNPFVNDTDNEDEVTIELEQPRKRIIMGKGKKKVRF